MSVSQSNPSGSAPAPTAAPGGAPPAPTPAQAALQVLKSAPEAAPPAPVTPDLSPLTSELSAIKAELAAYKAEQLETKKQQAMQEKLADLAKTLSPTDYPLISRVGATAHKAVFDYMVDHKQATGDWVTEAVAAKAVEDQLRELVKTLSPAPVAPPPAPASSHSWELTPATITNDMSGDVSRQLDPNPDPQRWNQEAMAMLRRAQNR